MKRERSTEIEFSGLKPGIYDFDFELDKSFFEPYSNEKLSNGDVNFHVKMEKTEHLMTLSLSFSGTVETICDRCLAPLTIPIEGEETMNVKFSDTAVSESYDEIVLPTNAYKVDLAQQFYEMAIVSMPLQCVHPDDEDGNPTCDPTMLQYISGSTDAGGNEEDDNVPRDEGADKDDSEIDPRWEALKALRENK